MSKKQDPVSNYINVYLAINYHIGWKADDYVKMKDVTTLNSKKLKSTRSIYEVQIDPEAFDNQEEQLDMEGFEEHRGGIEEIFKVILDKSTLAVQI